MPCVISSQFSSHYSSKCDRGSLSFAISGVEHPFDDTNLCSSGVSAMEGSVELCMVEEGGQCKSGTKRKRESNHSDKSHERKRRKTADSNANERFWKIF